MGQLEKVMKRYLAVKCPRCQQQAIVCELKVPEVPVFQQGVRIYVRCSNCEQEFDCLASGLQVLHEADSTKQSSDE